MPVAETELEFIDPYQLLVAVILSAQCTDKRVNLTTPAIFQKYPDVKSLSNTTFDDLFPFIKSISYPNNKTKHLIGIHESFDFASLNEYADVCDYYLFDTKTSDYGGSGNHFDWNLLKQYDNSKPIFLSGGLAIQDIPTIHDLVKDLNIHALDFNSKLEIDFGLKDVGKCRDAINLVREL